MPSLPSVSSNIPRDLRQFLDRTREIINGTGLDEIVTARQLVAAGIAEYTGNQLLTATDGTFYPTPPAPTGLDADGALANVIVTWDKATYNGHAYTEIWAAQQTQTQADADPEEFPDLGEAQLVGMAPGEVWVHNIGGGGSRWYWIRFINVEGQAGPYNAVDGFRGDTATDPAHLIELLSGQISESELASALSGRIDLIDGPASTVGTVAYKLADLQGQVNELLNLPQWDAAETYAVDDQIVHEGFLYVALAASTNVEPGTDATKWEQIGEYATIGDAVAAHTTQIAALDGGLGQEIIDRTTLATQLRGDYTGDDLAIVSQGLIYEERVARSAETSALAQDIQTLSAFANTKSRVFYQATEPTGTTDEPLNVGDMWIDTAVTYAEDYVEGDYVIRSNRMYRYDGTNWVDAMDFGFADWFSAIRTEKTARVEEDEALANQITTLTSATNGSLSAINQTLSTHTSDISANATAVTNLGSELRGADGVISAALQDEIQTRVDQDGALSQKITTLTAQVGEDIAAAVQEEATARANADGTIEAKYTVKVDIGNHVAGFGLLGSGNNAAPSFEFGVRADSFWLAPPTNTDANAPTQNLYPGYTWLQDGDPDTYETKYWTGSAWSTTPQNLPFVVRTTPTTINGETVPAGVYMADAFIQNGTITNAKIGNAAIDDAKIANLDAGKITTGFLSSDRIQASSITASMIDSRGLSIKDANGDVILAAGTPLNIANIEGLGTLAQFSELTLAAITDVGALASLDEVTQDDLESGLAGKIDGKIESHFQVSADDPASAWTGDERILHLGDMWWQTDTQSLHRYTYDSVNGGYSWEQLTDQTAIDAFDNAATAQDTADSKRRVFVAQPTTPYDIGDLWDRGATTGIWRCQTAKAAGEVYAGADWVVTADLTGNNTAAAITNQGTLATLSEVAYTNLESGLAGRLDGKVESFFQASTSDPAANWGDLATKNLHLGDFWWQTDNNTLHRYKYDGQNHVWERITDQTATDAFNNASTAQDTADGKRRVFVATPTVPYDIGDLWDRGTAGGLWRCQTAKAADGTYAISDWAVAADVTGDNIAAGIESQGSLATLSEVAYGSLAEALATLIDGKAEQYYGTSDPSTNWGTDAVRALHLNDTWYHTTDKALYVYRAGDDPATQGTTETYYWQKIENQDAIDAAAAASNAQDTADGKRRVFVAQPTPPYDIGDLWDRGDQAGGGIWRCKTARTAAQSYSASHWQVVADATFTGTAAAIADQGPFATLDSITKDNISTYIASGAITNAYIGDTIQSASYKAAGTTGGPAGWKIDKNGGMEMKDATFFGTLDIDSGSGSRLVIKSDRIEVWEGTTLRVRLGNLNP